MKRCEFIERMSSIDPKYVAEAANYRPKRKMGIRVIAIAACMAMMLTTVTVWALTLQTPKSTYYTISELAETKDGVFKLDVLDQKEIFSDISQDNMEQIFEAFDVIIDENDVIVLSNEVGSYFNGDKRAFDYTDDGKCIINTSDIAGDRTQIKLAMLLSVYFENFPDNIVPWDLNQPHNIMIIPFVYISFDYAEYGFDNALDYLVSCCEKNSEYGDGTFVLDPYHCDMFLYKEGFTLGSPAPNLLSFAADGLTFREEVISSVSAEETE